MKEFEIGKKYYDRNGQYEITSNDGNNVSAVYLDGDKAGQTKTFQKSSFSMILRVHENVLQDVKLEQMDSLGIKKNKVKDFKEINDSQWKKYHFTLGRLAKNGFLEMRTVPKTKDRDDERYKSAIGINPNEEISGYSCDEHHNTWATRMSISFDEDPKIAHMLFFPEGGELKDRDNAMQYYNTDWCWKLVEKFGFRLGRQQNIDDIKNNIPDEYLSAFNEGVTYE